MVRVKRGNVARKRRKKILQLAKGYRGAHSRLFRIANQQVMKALRYSYIGRKQKKRFFRKLWITRINLASRISLPKVSFDELCERTYYSNTKSLPKLSYSILINSLKRNKITLNRKMLAQLAILDPSTFSTLSEIAFHYPEGPKKSASLSKTYDKQYDLFN
jgi:large subunit ribosomal protein L20